MYIVLIETNQLLPSPGVDLIGKLRSLASSRVLVSLRKLEI